jgi:hypothetical protein
MAFAITDDHDAQERVLSELETHHGPHVIRGVPTADEIAATDRRVKYVTLAVYEKVGGAVKRDLFSTDDAGVFIADPALLQKLVSEKLERAARAVRREGWKMTYRQAGAFGAHVRKGKHGSVLVYAIRIAQTGDGRERRRRLPRNRPSSAYTVFNVAQIENLLARHALPVPKGEAAATH